MRRRLGREAEKVVRGKAAHRAGTKEKEGWAAASEDRRTSMGCKGEMTQLPQ